MIRRARAPYPAAASAWMAGEHPARVLDLGSGRGAFASSMADAGHAVFCLDCEIDQVAALPGLMGTLLHVVGQVEALPYASFSFQVATAAQTLHRFAPGLALSEIARVLEPGGHFAVAYNTRDDTVPWVRRLMALMQVADPEAMTSDYGVDSLDAVTDSPYFRPIERRSFRNWVPVTRAGLVQMVQRRPSTAALAPDVREQLLQDVGGLYDSSARAPEPLMLPFQATCWRAEVDHTELSLDRSEDDDILEIRL